MAPKCLTDVTTRKVTTRLNGTNGHANRRLGYQDPERLPSSICISVVIPVFNEFKTVLEVVRRVRAVPIAKEIIIVDDGSTDGTRDLLRGMEEQGDLRILYHHKNRGKGAALQTGFFQASGDIVVVQDADLEYDPSEYERLIEPILRDRADVVYGSRFSKPKKRGEDLFNSEVLTPFFRRRSFSASLHCFLNRALTTLSNLCTNLTLTDMETCYKVFRRAAILDIAPRLKENRFGIEPELTAKVARAGYRVCEIAIAYDRRSYKDGKKIGWLDGLTALCCIIRYSAWD
jgi:glycosyltransferase involved in cell wall biosynthesis